MRSVGLVRIRIFCIAGLLLIGACTPPLPSTPSSTLPAAGSSPTEPEVWHLVIISESSGGGLGKVYASRIERDLGVRVVLDDFAISDLSAGEVLDALRTGRSDDPKLTQLANALGEAQVVVMFGNPMASVDLPTQMSINDCFSGTSPTACKQNAFDNYEADLKAIWGEVFRLRAGQPTVARAIDVASPFVDKWKAAGTFAACSGCWQCVRDAVREAAAAYGIPFLSRYDAFNGVNHDLDAAVQGFVGPDGIHPNDIAQERTSDLLAGLGYDPVSPPAIERIVENDAIDLAGRPAAAD